MEKTISSGERLVQNPGNVFRQEEDGAFLFDPETGNLKYLNAMGVNVYELCDGVRTAGDIAEIVVAHYPDTAKEQIESEITAFLESLVEMTFLIRGTPHG